MTNDIVSICKGLRKELVAKIIPRDSNFRLYEA